jgi:hypothetical protein
MHMLNKLLTILILLMTSDIYGVSVRFQVLNSTGQVATIKIFATSLKTGINESLGESITNPHTTAEFLFKVKRYSLLTVYAEFKNGGKSEAISKLVTKKIDKEWLPDIQFIYNYSSDYSNLKGFEIDSAADHSFSDLSQSIYTQSQNSYDSFCGSIILVKSILHKDSILYRTTSKGPMCVTSNVGKENINYLVAKGDSVIERHIPFLSQMNIDWNSADLFEISIVKKIEKFSLPAIDSIINLNEFSDSSSNSVKLKISEFLETDSTLKIYRINSADIVEATLIEVRPLMKLGPEELISSKSIITPAGNYIYTKPVSEIFGTYVENITYTVIDPSLFENTKSFPHPDNASFIRNYKENISTVNLK